MKRVGKTAIGNQMQQNCRLEEVLGGIARYFWNSSKLYLCSGKNSRKTDGIYKSGIYKTSFLWWKNDCMNGIFAIP